MKRKYIVPNMLVTTITVEKVISSSPLGTNIKGDASSTYDVLTHGRNSYDDEDASNAAETGWTDGLW